jgi:hypothetical protein
MRRSRPVGAPPPVARARHEVVLCEACGAGDRDEELLLCDLCDRGRHTFCLRPILAAVPLGPWLCPDCTPRPKRIISASPYDLDLAIILSSPLSVAGLCRNFPLNPFSLLGFPMKQSKIIDFFRIQKGPSDPEPAKCGLSQGNLQFLGANGKGAVLPSAYL